jgi:hypothetical protein
MQILGLFIGIGVLSFVAYGPTAKAMPAAPGVAAALVESDGLVVKTQNATANQARRVSRRTARRTSGRQ